MIGALLVLVTDTVGRLAFAPLQTPAGIVIAPVGGPFFAVALASPGSFVIVKRVYAFNLFIAAAGRLHRPNVAVPVQSFTDDPGEW